MTDRDKVSRDAQTFLDDSGTLVEAVFKLKKKMLERNLTRARTNCPNPGCGGTLHARLAGRKNHIHAACEKCGQGLME